MHSCVLSSSTTYTAHSQMKVIDLWYRQIWTIWHAWHRAQQQQLKCVCFLLSPVISRVYIHVTADFGCHGRPVFYKLASDASLMKGTPKVFNWTTYSVTVVICIPSILIIKSPLSMSPINSKFSISGLLSWIYRNCEWTKISVEHLLQRAWSICT